MEQEEFERVLRRCMDDLKDETIGEELKRNTRYQELVEREGILEQRYMDLDLKEEQRETVEAYVNGLTETDVEYQMSVYSCAVRDTIRTCIYLGLLRH